MMKADKKIYFVMVVLLWGSVPACKKAGKYDVEFEARYPEAKQAARLLESDRSKISGYQPVGLTEKLKSSFFHFNLTTVFSKDNLGAIEQTMRQLELSLTRCLEDEGAESLKRLSFWLVERFEERFRALADTVGERQDRMAIAEGKAPKSEAAARAYRQFVEVAGDFLSHAAKSGLVTLSPDKGILYGREAIFFMRLAFKVRWSRIMPEQTKPLGLLLTDFERKWYEIWVAERSKSASLKRRLGAVTRLAARDSDYPVHQSRGIIYYQNRSYQKAQQEFEKALEKTPDDPKLKAYLAKARRKAK